jgi:hypothetical protein
MTIREGAAMPALRFVGALFRWLLLAALLGQLVFAHGCHGDEDHELFGVVRPTAIARP